MKFFEDIQHRRAKPRSAATPSRPRSIKAFAARFDPQPFHLDEAAADALAFRPALCASGWHTACVWMRLRSITAAARTTRAARAASRSPRSGLSPGFRDLQWLAPVYAGDTITYATEVIDKRAVVEPAGMGPHDVAQHRRQSERRAGDRASSVRPSSSAGRARDAMMTPPATRPSTIGECRQRDERARAGVACGAHALHDGYTDLIYVMLPVWQAEFGLGYAELGLLRGVFAGTMASFQIPVGAARGAVGVPRSCSRSAPRLPARLLPRRRERGLCDAAAARCSSAGSAPARSIRSRRR